MKKMPIVTLQALYHVGYMDPTLKRKDSHEGAGLSVSTEPDAWMRINPMTEGPTFELVKKHNQFLDFYAITKEQEKVIIDWGKKADYITPVPLYKFSYFDDEMDAEYYQLFETREKADMEAEGYEAAVVEIAGFRSTRQMDEKVMASHSSFNSIDLLATLYAEEVLDIDGVYWFEELDIYAYSAPRGVISPAKVSTWKAQLKEKRLG